MKRTKQERTRTGGEIRPYYFTSYDQPLYYNSPCAHFINSDEENAAGDNGHGCKTKP
jgi:hypothetical protein